MANQTALEIAIKTYADARGITDIDKATKELTGTLEKAQAAAKQTDNSAEALAQGFNDANRKAQEFGNSLKGLSNDQLLAVEERLREQIRTTQAAGGNVDDLKRKLEETFNQRTTGQVDALGGSLNRTAGAAGTLNRVGQRLGQELGAVSRGMQGLNQVSNGLAQGGLAGVITAGRGAVTVFSSLATGALGTLLIPALGLAAAALLLFKQRAEQSAAAIDKMYGDNAKSAEAYNQATAAYQEEQNKRFEEQLANLERLRKGYEDLTAEIERNASQTSKRNAAQKDLDLANATTPEERAAVEQRFADIEAEDTVLKAGLQRDTALGQLAKLREELRAVESEAASAEQDAADALSLTEGLGARTDASAIDARQQAKITKEKADSAQQKLGEVRTRLLAEMKAVEDEIEDAALTLETAATKRAADAIAKARAAVTSPETASAPTSTASPSSAGAPRAAASGVDSLRLSDLQSQRRAEVAAAEAEIKRLEDERFRLPALSRDTEQYDREIARRRTALDQGNRSFDEQFETTARSAQASSTPARSAPARSSSSGESAPVAATLQKAAKAQEERDAVIIDWANVQAASADRTKRQIANAREKSQP